eukprot:COSAG04_NODE_1667_length_6004_cov_3.397290_2_plen_110_part_00
MDDRTRTRTRRGRPAVVSRTRSRFALASAGEKATSGRGACFHAAPCERNGLPLFPTCRSATTLPSGPPRPVSPSDCQSVDRRPWGEVPPSVAAPGSWVADHLILQWRSP